MRKRTAGKAFAILAASAIAILAGCGKDDSEKVYLDEIKAEDYVKLGEYKGLSVVQFPRKSRRNKERLISITSCP